MKIYLRIPGPTYAEAVRDLDRPHPFAAERIGFFSTTVGRLKDEELLVLVNGYHPVPDDQYVDDPYTAARIGRQAIRESLQRILDSGCGQLHVHAHNHLGFPFPSPTDREETPALVQSMAGTNRACASGWLILSRNRASADIIPPGEDQLQEVARITVSGFPFQRLKP